MLWTSLLINTEGFFKFFNSLFLFCNLEVKLNLILLQILICWQVWKLLKALKLLKYLLENDSSIRCRSALHSDEMFSIKMCNLGGFSLKSSFDKYIETLFRRSEMGILAWNLFFIQNRKKYILYSIYYF